MEVARGKHLAFKIPGSKRFVRCSSLGENYSDEAIAECISGKQIVAPKGERATPMLIDIQTKMQQANSPGYKRWASMFNLKEMEKTLNYLQGHGLLAYADLESACDATVQRYYELAGRTKANSERMKEISELQNTLGHIIRPVKSMPSIANCRRKSKNNFMPNTPAPLFRARQRSGILTAWG